MTPEIINILLTVILIAVYLYNTNSQNNKIKTQSGIINDLRDHIKFFDIQKIKEYVELREGEKDKLLELTRKSIEKELESKYKTDKNELNLNVKEISQITKNVTLEFIKEPVMYVVLDLLTKTDDVALKMINTYFPTQKDTIRSLYQDTKATFVTQYGTSDLNKIMESLEKK